VPRVFWLSASVALLLVAVSASYFLLVILPTAQRHRDELAAEAASRQAQEKRTIDCAEQSRRTGEDFGKYSAFWPPSHVSGVSNHYNQKLSKCVVDVQTVDKGGTAEFVMNAYEQSNILWCSTRILPKAASPMQRICMDSQNKRIDSTEADKQIDALMRE